MKIFKIAQSQKEWDFIAKTIKTIFAKIGEHMGATPIYDGRYTVDARIEKTDDADPFGTNYKYVSFNRDNLRWSATSVHANILFEKIYESEIAHDNYDKSFFVEIDLNKPDEALSLVMKALEKIK